MSHERIHEIYQFIKHRSKADPHDVRILEDEVVKLARVLSNVEEANLDKADQTNYQKTWNIS